MKLGLPPFITTLAMMQVARGLAFILAHGQPIPLANSAPFDWLGTGYLLNGIPGFPGIPYAVLVMAVVAIVFAIAARPHGVRALRARARRQRRSGALGGDQHRAASRRSST